MTYKQKSFTYFICLMISIGLYYVTEKNHLETEADLVVTEAQSDQELKGMEKIIDNNNVN